MTDEILCLKHLVAFSKRRNFSGEEIIANFRDLVTTQVINGHFVKQNRMAGMLQIERNDIWNIKGLSLNLKT